MRVLLIKMSSLGDVVHALAGVTDAARRVPGIKFDWVIEEGYEEIARWHPAVRATIASPFRRWRKAPLGMIRNAEWLHFFKSVRQEKYDLVLDAQGLLKSALAGRCAHGPLAGRSFGTAREPAAALFYQMRHRVDLSLAEVEQLRQLFALALGYDHSGSDVEFGIDRSRVPTGATRSSYAVFLHGAAWATKLWPEENWIRLGQEVSARGIKVLLPHGNEIERARAERLAQAFNGEVLPRTGLPEIAPTLARARFVVGLDTGLTHVAIALGTRTLTLYGPSIPVYDKVAGTELIHLCSTTSRVVDTARTNSVAADEVLHAIEPWLRRSSQVG
jgi:heptosyltransferase I